MRALWRPLWLAPVILAAGVFAAAEPSNAAVLEMPAVVSGATRTVNTAWISPNQLKPPQCASQNLSRLLVVTGTSGTATDVGTLVIGEGTVGQNLTGGKAADCILAGGAPGTVNALKGGGGGDVLVGGKYASQSYLGGSGSDYCYYRAADKVPNQQSCNVSVLLP